MLIHHAVSGGHLAVVDCLVNHGDDVIHSEDNVFTKNFTKVPK